MRFAMIPVLFLTVSTACSSTPITSSTADASAADSGTTNSGPVDARAAVDSGFDPVECRPDVVQKDLDSQNPEGPDKPAVAPYWIGPGVDRATGKPGILPGMIMTSTYLQLRTDGASMKRFGELAGPVAATLQKSQGLIAALIVTSPKCAVARTLVVWKDEASMMTFVSSEAHSKAMAFVGDVSRGGSITTNWIATGAADGSYTTAAAKLAAHKGPVY